MKGIHFYNEDVLIYLVAMLGFTSQHLTKCIQDRSQEIMENFVDPTNSN
jgi:hypothetical protein